MKTVRNILIILGVLALLTLGFVFRSQVLGFTGTAFGWIVSVAWYIFFLAIAIVAVAAGFVWFAHEAAKKNTWTTTVGQEEFKFVAKGESLLKVLPNLKDAGLDENGNVTEVEDEMVAVYLNPAFQLLVDMLGIYWVSILYPARSVFTYKIDKYRLKQESQLPTKHSIKDLVEVESDAVIDSLRRYFPRPLFIPEVELKDGIFIDIVVMSEYEVINPYKAIFKWKGKFFPLLDAPTEGAVNDFGSTITYAELLNVKRGKGSKFSTDIEAMIKDKVEGITGIRQTSCYIIQFGISETEPEVQEAARAKEVNRLKGEGIKTLADAEAYRIIKLAEAGAMNYSEAISKMKALGVDPDVAAMQIGRKLALEQVAGPTSKITTYLEGGNGAKTGVNINTPTTTPSTKP